MSGQGSPQAGGSGSRSRGQKRELSREDGSGQEQKVKPSSGTQGSPKAGGSGLQRKVTRRRTTSGSSDTQPGTSGGQAARSRRVTRSRSISGYRSPSPRPGGSTGRRAPIGTFEDFILKHETATKDYPSQIAKLAALGWKVQKDEDGDEILLGEGGFGKVILARRGFSPKFLAAVKVMDMQMRNAKRKRSKDEIEKFKENVSNEIKTHAKVSSLNNPNLVKQLAHYRIDEKIFIILEYCNNTDLFEYLSEILDHFVDAEARYWFRQLVNGLHALHEANIVHRDLKCENVLVHRNPRTGSSILKICDFGFATENRAFGTPIMGTKPYLAPEVYRVLLASKEAIEEDEESHETYDGKAGDIWALGCILYDMIFHETPFEDNKWDTIEDCKESIERTTSKASDPSTFYPGLHPRLKSFISRLLCVDVTRRFTTAEIQLHPWFTAPNVAEPTAQHFSDKFPQEYIE